MFKKIFWSVLLEALTIGFFFLGNVHPIFDIPFWILFGGQILAILLWFFIGCYNVIKSDILKYRTYVIFKKFHMVLFKLPQVIFYLKAHKLVKRQFIFTDSCKYNIPEHGINKLFGFSFGWHHDNSVRFGWKFIEGSSHLPNLTYPDKIEICAYLYVDGNRREQRICEVNINQLYTYHIEYYIANRSNHMVTLWVRSNLDISEGNTNYQKFTYTLPNNIPKWGYKLFPYFGTEGKTHRAPHKIKIKEIYY